MAERGGGYWIIDLTAVWQFHPRVCWDPMLPQIQFWTLTVNDDGSAPLKVLSKTIFIYGKKTKLSNILHRK
jgi:hypothetical protein